LPTVDQPDPPAGLPLLEDITDGSGLAFTYRNGEEANHVTLLESLGGGVALIDFDGDGRLDVFLPGGGHYGGADQKQILGHPGKLFRNLGQLKFKDVTEEAGLDQPPFYTHGAAVADYDRDGWPDLLVTGWGRLALFHNEADGKGGRRFAEGARQAGLTNDLWSSSAAWGDLDGDGFPDLYVCNYVDWSFANHPACSYDGKTPDVCSPKNFEPLPHRLYLNQGDGTFREVGKAAGMRVPREETDYDGLRHLGDAAKKRLKTADRAGAEKEYGKGLGALIVDVNADGRPDVYVANDTVDNFLYMNRGRKKGEVLLEEVGLAAGVARDDRGNPNASMGVDAGDYDGCGRPSLFVTNFESEKHALYHNECLNGCEFFFYSTQVTGISALGQTYVGWGTQFADIDLDGWLDLVLFNGHIVRYPTKGQAARKQRPLLLQNVAADGQPQRRRFIDVSRQGGAYFLDVHCARGAAFGDLDNDGRLDVAVSQLNEPVVLLRGTAPADRHWLGVELAGKDHASVVGARVILESGGLTQTRFSRGGGSYASSNDPRHLFGLGAADKAGKLTVVWPSGKEQTWEGLAVDRYWKLTEGEKEAR
jgi:hypothetical protein